MTNNRGYIYVLFILLGITLSSESNAAWYFTLNPPSDNQKISDNPLEFTISGLSCGATKTEFLRLDDGYIHEFRQLYCKASDGTLFYAQANCRNGAYIPTQLLIEKGGTKFFPTLYCDAHKTANFPY
ncbi:MAG: hypothetical protein PHQ03_07835 [Methylococcales bacterium]|nr:hypothetical protein [Methylococcales bacterium]